MAPKITSVTPAGQGNRQVYKDKIKPTDIRLSNINAAKGYKHIYLLYLFTLSSYPFNDFFRILSLQSRLFVLILFSVSS